MDALPWDGLDLPLCQPSPIALSSVGMGTKVPVPAAPISDKSKYNTSLLPDVYRSTECLAYSVNVCKIEQRGGHNWLTRGSQFVDESQHLNRFIVFGYQVLLLNQRLIVHCNLWKDVLRACELIIVGSTDSRPFQGSPNP
ncbi:hypothetical protein CSKR_203285 [Clonorchis sinensis]|uniref:Uncharacterized protein n=1 Tax=Clonorchis sinensis TaxID=79923 RepID=A0A8T1M8G1_CLOSI|nr:hypothetical protein CSKR_203285 [Clonorchis sinensis]